jgi:hypothetical protein
LFLKFLKENPMPKASKATKPYVVVRTQSAGCFAGYLVSRTGKEVVLTDARRLFYWAGASSLSELAVRGTAMPTLCKFPVPVPRIVLTEAIEIISTTPEGAASIQGVPLWTQF